MTNSDEPTDKFLNLLHEFRPDHSAQEYGFEMRLLAGLRERVRNTPAMLAWRLFPYLAAGILFLSAWIYQTVSTSEPPPSEGLFADSSLEYHN